MLQRLAAALVAFSLSTCFLLNSLAVGLTPRRAACLVGVVASLPLGPICDCERCCKRAEVLTARPRPFEQEMIDLCEQAQL